MKNFNYPAKLKMENGQWLDCQISHPNQEPPIRIPGPLGTTEWQESSFSKYNAKITLNARSPILEPGKYEIHFGGKEYVFETKNPKIDIIFGDILKAI